MIGLGRGKNKMQIESDFVRRSSRRQKVRGEREFIVNSDMMLRDFKVKVNIHRNFLLSSSGSGQALAQSLTLAHSGSHSMTVTW